MTSAIEEAGVQIRASGTLEKWFEGSDQRVKKVSETVNGALLSELLREGGHREPGCANIYREGRKRVTKSWHARGDTYNERCGHV